MSRALLLLTVRIHVAAMAAIVEKTKTRGSLDAQTKGKCDRPVYKEGAQGSDVVPDRSQVRCLVYSR